MEQYPTISRDIRNIPVFAFDKLDGSNMRVEWSKKSGFYKYGSRNQLIDHTHPFLGDTIELFNNKYADDLRTVFRKQKLERATAFLEYAGANSFAGQHEPDETHTLTLFDMHIYKKGMMLPQDFLKLFGHLDIARLLWEGKANQNLVEQVHNGTLPGMTFEGVVCKSPMRDNRNRVVSFKIKNKAWLETLAFKYGKDTTMYRKLV